MHHGIEPEDLPLHCRTCLNVIKGNKYGTKELPESLTKLFQQCAGKIQKEGYPQFLCFRCYWRQKEFHETCQKCNQFLEDLFKPITAKEVLAQQKAENSNHLKDSDSEEEEKVQMLLEDESTTSDTLDFEEITIKEESCSEEQAPNHYSTADLKALVRNEAEFAAKCKKPKHAEKAVCKLCKRTYSSFSALRLHMITHLKKRPYQCDKCDRGFNIPCRLKQHFEEEHGDFPLQIACKFGCGRIFQCNETATAHYRKIHSSMAKSLSVVELTTKAQIESKPTETVLPNNEFNKTDSAVNPRLNETKQSNDSSKEIKTDFQIDSEVNDSEQYYETSNAIEADSQVDPDADEIYEADNKVEDDIDNFPKTISETTCKICFRKCSTKTTFKIHMQIHEGQRPFQCEQCGSRFFLRSVLNTHMKEIHTDVPLSIPCKYGCGKIFRRSNTAQFHYRYKHEYPDKGIPPADRSRICEECGKVCRNLSHLKEHLLQHKPLEQSPYSCKLCGRRFRTKKCMKTHIERHEPVRKYECPHCGIRKATRKDLSQHVNIHTKTKNYPCTFCKKIFFNSENLRRHKLNIHLGIKKYKCRQCEISFTKSEERIKHEAQHNNNT